MSVVFEPLGRQALGFDQRISQLTFYFLKFGNDGVKFRLVLAIRALRAPINEEQSRLKSDILGTPLGAPAKPKPTSGNPGAQ